MATPKRERPCSGNESAELGTNEQPQENDAFASTEARKLNKVTLCHARTFRIHEIFAIYIRIVFNIATKLFC